MSEDNHSPSLFHDVATNSPPGAPSLSQASPRTVSPLLSNDLQPQSRTTSRARARGPTSQNHTVNFNSAPDCSPVLVESADDGCGPPYSGKPSTATSRDTTIEERSISHVLKEGALCPPSVVTLDVPCGDLPSPPWLWKRSSNDDATAFARRITLCRGTPRTVHVPTSIPTAVTGLAE